MICDSVVSSSVVKMKGSSIMTIATSSQGCICRPKFLSPVMSLDMKDGLSTALCTLTDILTNFDTVFFNLTGQQAEDELGRDMSHFTDVRIA